VEASVGPSGPQSIEAKLANEGSVVREARTANEVLIVGEIQDPRPGAGECRIRIAASGINRGDIRRKKCFCQLWLGHGTTCIKYRWPACRVGR
jgi:hypothetical protein